MSLFLTFAAADASGPAALGLDFQAFLIQLITFLIVFLILRQWAFKPIITMLNQRRDLIEQGVTLGEKMRAEEASAKAAASRVLRDARVQGDKIMTDAEAAARQKIQIAETTAQERATDIVEEAKMRIEQSKQRARRGLKAEMISLVSDVSEAIIKKNVTSDKNTKLIEQALREQRA